MNKWLFLRGLTRESKHWGDFTQAFEVKMGAEVQTIDFPGTGNFIDLPSPKTVDQIADHIFEQLQKSAWTSCNVLAHSMGGMVSASLLEKYPQVFKKIVWMNTSFANLSRWYHRLHMKHVSKLTRLGVYFSDIEEREKLIFDMTVNINRDEKTLQSWIDIQKTSPVTRKTSMYQMLAASRFELKAAPKQPVLLLCGANDRFVNPQCTRDIGSFLNLEPVFHPEAGHDLPVDAPDWIMDQIKAWL